MADASGVPRMKLCSLMSMVDCFENRTIYMETESDRGVGVAVEARRRPIAARPRLVLVRTTAILR